MTLRDLEPARHTMLRVIAILGLMALDFVGVVQQEGDRAQGRAQTAFRILDGNGRPIRGVRCELLSDGKVVGMIHSNANGDVAVMGVMDWQQLVAFLPDWTVRVFDRGTIPEEIRLLGTGQIAACLEDLTDGTTPQGAVRFVPANRYQDAMLQLASIEEPARRAFVSKLPALFEQLLDPDGCFLFGGLPEECTGTIWLPKEYELDGGSGVIEVNETQDLGNVKVKRRSGVAGIVRDEDSCVAVQDVLVDIIAEDKIVLSAVTDSAGRFFVPLDKDAIRLPIERIEFWAADRAKASAYTYQTGWKGSNAEFLIGSHTTQLMRILDQDGKPLVGSIALRYGRECSIANGNTLLAFAPERSAPVWIVRFGFTPKRVFMASKGETLSVDMDPSGVVEIQLPFGVAARAVLFRCSGNAFYQCRGVLEQALDKYHVWGQVDSTTRKVEEGQHVIEKVIRPGVDGFVRVSGLCAQKKWSIRFIGGSQETEWLVYERAIDAHDGVQRFPLGR